MYIHCSCRLTGLHLVDHLQGLRTIALGYYLSCKEHERHNIQLAERTDAAHPLPEVVSRLTALSSLTLHNAGWKHTPDGLRHLSRVGAASSIQQTSLSLWCVKPLGLATSLAHVCLW